MKLSKRKITAKKIQKNQIRKLMRLCKRDVLAFGQLCFPKLMKGKFAYVSAQKNPFVYAEGIKISHRLSVMYMPPTA